MRCQVAHAVRGCLRVRYPAGWLRPRVPAVEAAIRSVTGVRTVRSSAVTGSVRIEYDPFRLAEAGLIASLHELEAELRSGPSGDVAVPERGRVSPGRAPLWRLLAASAALSATGLPLPTAVTTGLVLAVDLPALTRAGSALARRRVDGDVLEAVTLLLLTARGQTVAVSLLVWLGALGEYVLARTLGGARRSLREVVAPPGATVARLDDGRTRRIRVAELRAGDTVTATGGERLPVDGTVLHGEALVNQQTMTGEALPVERRAGDPVFAATTVEYGEIAVRVERVGLDTAVGRIVRTIEATTDEKSGIQDFVERLADRSVTRSIGLAAAGTALSASVDSGTAILVSDYGLAARVGVPTAILSSIDRAFRQDILIKGPKVLENLARVDTVVFDKTGTLTIGMPRVTRAARYGSGTEDDLIRLVAAAERPFHHPIARAVSRLAAERGLRLPDVAATVEQVGLGVSVRIEGRRVLVGSRRLMEAHEVVLRAALDDEHAAHAVGGSPLFVALDGRLAGMLVLQDQLRPDAPDAVRALRARRMRNVILLSGDHARPSRVIAESLGLRHHYADLLPEDKARLIATLRADGRVVAMVGDGVNDALALGESDVGIAVPGGAEVATAAADVVLLRGGLDRVVRALDLARDSIAAVRRTLDIASRASLVVVGLASLGLAQPALSILLSHGTTVAAAIVNARRGSSSVRPDP
jgi:heavy metal translocating P-type ATPase